MSMVPVMMAPVVPPSVFRFSPVMNDAALELRKISGYACSSGVDRRPSGIG